MRHFLSSSIASNRREIASATETTLYGEALFALDQLPTRIAVYPLPIAIRVLAANYVSISVVCHRCDLRHATNAHTANIPSSTAVEGSGTAAKYARASHSSTDTALELPYIG